MLNELVAPVKRIKTSRRAKPSEHGHLFVPRRFHRPALLKWLRRTHAWFGLWGAILGLLFGVTGILLNHRAVMKIPAANNTETEWQIELSDSAPVDASMLAHFLQTELKLNRPPATLSTTPGQSAPWGNGKVRQPERWQINFVTPNETVMTDYWVGNRAVSVRRLEPNAFAWLTRLHMSTGAGAGWILLADTLAGGMIVLALTGILLWTRLHGPRLAALGLIAACLALTLTFALTNA